MSEHVPDHLEAPHFIGTFYAREPTAVARSGYRAPRSREPPKRSGESESIEDRLVLLTGVGAPIG